MTNPEQTKINMGRAHYSWDALSNHLIDSSLDFNQNIQYKSKYSFRNFQEN